MASEGASRRPPALEDSPAARWLVPFVGSSQRAPWVVVPFVDDEIPPARALAAAIGHLASYLAKKKPEETRLKAKSKPRRIGTPYRSAGLGTRI